MHAGGCKRALVTKAHSMHPNLPLLQSDEAVPSIGPLNVCSLSINVPSVLQIAANGVCTQAHDYCPETGE